MSTSGFIVTVGLNPAIDRVIEVDRFTLGAHQTGRLLRRAPAGKSINVSRVMASLGVRTTATGFLGQDSREDFRAVFATALIAEQFFYLPGRTRENITILDPVAGQETHIRDAGLSVDDRNLLRLSSKLRLLASPGNIIIFAGSLAPGVTPEAYASLVDLCITGGARVAVDTSGPALRAVADRRLWLVKPNAAELADLVGRQLPGQADRIAAARELSRRIDIVLLTAGAEGAYLFAGDRALHARIPLDADRVLNTVGCGDVLLGAFLAGVRRNQPLATALADAVAAATASACNMLTAEFDRALATQLRQRLEVCDV